MSHRSIYCLSMILLLLGWSIPSQAQPSISGYYEHTLEVDYGEDVGEEFILDLSKVRLDINAGGGEGMFEFRSNVNFVQYHTGVTYDISPYLPDDVVQQLNLMGVGTQFQLEQSRIYLDNAFLTVNTGNMRFRAGKQQLSWGTGYSNNPTDLFHKKTLVDPSYEKEGVTALRLDYRWGIGGNLSLITALGQNFKDSGYAIRLGTHLSSIGYDIAMTTHHVVDSTMIDLTTFGPLLQNRDALGLEFSGPFLGLGFWMEGNYNWMESEDDFARVVTGMDFTFNNGLYVMVEGLVNMRQLWEPPYEISDWLSYMMYGEPVGRGWVIGAISKELSTLTSSSFYVFRAWDGGWMLNPRFEWSVAQNADASFFAAMTFGPEDGAFPPGYYAGYARVTVYF